MQQQKNDRLLRIDEVIGEQPKGKSTKQSRKKITESRRKAIIPLSRTAFYAAIRRGELPKPKKIGRTSVWAESELRAAIASLTIDSTKAGT